jgi:hypothetical protein
MTDQERDSLLADCLEDFHRRKAMGESPTPDDYRRRLGDSHAEFLDVLEASDTLDEAMKPPVEPALPRPFGAYTLLKEIGRGSMGVVYEALHRDLRRKVAIKILRTGFDTEPVAIERFHEEAVKCAHVHHEHIVDVYEAGEAEGRHYYTMRLLPGQPLSVLVKEGQAPKGRALFAALSEVADALHALHEAGIVHRDVKPSNIVVLPDGKMVLADFGLARTLAAAHLTKTGEAIGTPLYMSPEQMLGKKEEIDARADVYGLGATLYEALTGRPPFKTDDLSALMRMVLAQVPASVRAVAPQVDADAERIVMKALEKRREDRQPSAAALRDQMKAYATGGYVSDRPVPAWVHFARKVRRHALPLAAGVAVAVGAFLWWTHRPATLEVLSDQDVQVAINGTIEGSAPLKKEVPAGKVVVTISADGFLSRDYPKDVGAGAEVVIDAKPLVPLDSSDPAAFNALWKGFSGKALPPLEEPSRDRSGGDGDLALIYPREDVRVEDLKGSYRVVLMDELLDLKGATIEFRRGRETLAKIPFDNPTRMDVEGDIPAAVRAAAKTGQTITWGVYFPPESKSKKPITTEIKVVATDLSKQLERIEKRWDEHPATIRALLRAQLLLDRRLFTAAYREASSVLAVEKANVRALAIAQQALERMDLRDSPAMADVLAALQDVADKQPARKAAVYRQGPR